MFPAYERDSSPHLPLTRTDSKDDEEMLQTTPKRKLNIKNTLVKWFIDCITMGALFNTLAFLILMGLLKSQTSAQILKNIRTVSFSAAFSILRLSMCSTCKMRDRNAQSVSMADIPQETIPIIVDSYKIWPIASIINFAFIPVEKRIVFLSSVGVLWGIYMSLVAAALK